MRNAEVKALLPYRLEWSAPRFCSAKVPPQGAFRASWRTRKNRLYPPRVVTNYGNYSPLWKNNVFFVVCKLVFT